MYYFFLYIYDLYLFLDFILSLENKYWGQVVVRLKKISYEIEIYFTVIVRFRGNFFRIVYLTEAGKNQKSRKIVFIRQCS